MDGCHEKLQADAQWLNAFIPMLSIVRDEIGQREIGGCLTDHPGPHFQRQAQLALEKLKDAQMEFRSLRENILSYLE